MVGYDANDEWVDDHAEGISLAALDYYLQQSRQLASADDSDDDSDFDIPELPVPPQAESFLLTSLQEDTNPACSVSMQKRTEAWSDLALDPALEAMLTSLASDLDQVKVEASEIEGQVEAVKAIAASAQVKVTAQDLTEDEAAQLKARKEAELADRAEEIEALQAERIRRDGERLRRDLEEAMEREAIEQTRIEQERAISDAMAAEEDVLKQQVLVVEKETEETRQRLAEETRELQEQRLQEMASMAEREADLHAQIAAGDAEMAMLREQEMMEEEDAREARWMAWEREEAAMAMDRELASMYAEDRLVQATQKAIRQAQLEEAEAQEALAAEEVYTRQLMAAERAAQEALVQEITQEEFERVCMKREEGLSKAYAAAKQRVERMAREEAARRAIEEQKRLEAERRAAAERERLQTAERARQRAEQLAQDQIAQCGHFRAGAASAAASTHQGEEVGRTQKAWQHKLDREAFSVVQQADQRLLDEVKAMELTAAAWCGTQVAKLELSHENVTNIADIDYPHLLSLELSDNNIAQIAGLDALPELRELSLKANQLTTCTGLGSCSHLWTLKLDDNEIRSIDGLGAAANTLHTLSMNGNVLLSLQGISQCASLGRLELYRNELGEISADDAAQLPPGLLHLDLGRNTLTKVDFAALSKCPRLISLILYSNTLLEIPEDLLQHAVLRELRINCNGLVRVPRLGWVPMLQQLYLHDNNISSVDSGALGACPLLATLDLSFNRIEYLTVFQALQRCSCLEQLMLNDNPVAELPGYRSAALGCLPKLQELDSNPVPSREVLLATDAWLRQCSAAVVPFLQDVVHSPFGHLPLATRPAAGLSVRSRPAALMWGRLHWNQKSAGGCWNESTFTMFCSEQATGRAEMVRAAKKAEACKSNTHSGHAAGVALRMRHEAEFRGRVQRDLEAHSCFQVTEHQAVFCSNEQYYKQQCALQQASDEEAIRESERIWQLQLQAQQEAQRLQEQERQKREEERTRQAAAACAAEEEVRHLKAVHTTAALKLQRMARGWLVRKRVWAALQGAKFEDDDDFDYGGVADDFLPDLSGLDDGDFEMPFPSAPLWRPAAQSPIAPAPPRIPVPRLKELSPPPSPPTIAPPPRPSIAKSRPSSTVLCLAAILIMCELSGNLSHTLSWVQRIVIDTAAPSSQPSSTTSTQHIVESSPRCRVTITPSRGGLMKLADEGPPQPVLNGASAPVAWGERSSPDPTSEPMTSQSGLHAFDTPSTARSMMSNNDAENEHRGESKVATKLREAVSDWGIKDPVLMRTFAKRQAKLKRHGDKAAKRKEGRDPGKRLEKFYRAQDTTSGRAGSVASSSSYTPRDSRILEGPQHDDEVQEEVDYACGHDDGDVSVSSFFSERAREPLEEMEFKSDAPNMKLTRSLRSRDDGRAPGSGGMGTLELVGAPQAIAPSRPKKGAMRGQRAVLSNNFL